MKVIELRLWELEHIDYDDYTKIGWIIARPDLSSEDKFVIFEKNIPILIKMDGKIHVFPSPVFDDDGSFVQKEQCDVKTYRMIYKGYRAITPKDMIIYLSHYQNEAEAEKYLLEGLMVGDELGHKRMITFKTESGAMGAYINHGEVVIASRVEPYSKVFGDSMKVCQDEIMARERIIKR